MISCVPGIVRLVPGVSVANHKISRFTPSIDDNELPKRFQTHNMEPYDGTTDPEEHITQYREKMEIIRGRSHLKDVFL